MGTQHLDAVTVNSVLQCLKRGILTALCICAIGMQVGTRTFFLLMLEKMAQLLQVCLSLVVYVS